MLLEEQFKHVTPEERLETLDSISKSFFLEPNTPYETFLASLKEYVKKEVATAYVAGVFQVNPTLRTLVDPKEPNNSTTKAYSAWESHGNMHPLVGEVATLVQTYIKDKGYD